MHVIIYFDPEEVAIEMETQWLFAPGKDVTVPFHKLPLIRVHPNKAAS